ncbi:MAG: prenyltransferase/squalene oxidase repeat-containing protein, partial [Planctomycetota bacterium]
MRWILVFLLLSTVAVAGPSDFLRYEATKNKGRVVVRTHAHVFGPEGYRPVSPQWSDVATILGLSPIPGEGNGKLKFALELSDVGTLKVKGEYAISGDEAKITYKFSAKETVPGGTALVTVQLDPKRRIVRSSSMTFEGTRVEKQGQKPFSEKWTFKLHSERLHGAPGFQKAVDTAIDRGVAYLMKRQQEDGSFGARHEYGIGTTALCLFTLSSCGVPPDDPVLVKGLANILKQTPPTTYDRAVALMALDRAYTPPGELARAHKNRVKEFKRNLPPERRAWAMRVAADLEKYAASPGSWAYGKRVGGNWPDSSNTQYAVLGLRAAAKLGYKAQPRTWLGVLQHFRMMRGKEQLSGTIPLVREGEAVTEQTTRAGAKVKKKQGRGYRYRGDYKKTTATMSTAAIASLLIAREELQRIKRKLSGKKSADIDRAVLGAWLWLDRNWAMARAPGHHPPEHRLYYYLYAIERAAVLDRVKRVGVHDWYFEGAAWLLD